MGIAHLFCLCDRYLEMLAIASENIDTLVVGLFCKYLWISSKFTRWAIRWELTSQMK
ncbi:hypothetical protein APA_3540 [Pseudanabaena sp. lw0831]|nr:hypothetical protein APA_3540 [Pseudanabaena sp. lw0831]